MKQTLQDQPWRALSPQMQSLCDKISSCFRDEHNTCILYSPDMRFFGLRIKVRLPLQMHRTSNQPGVNYKFINCGIAHMDKQNKKRPSRDMKRTEGIEKVYLVWLTERFS